MNRKQRRAEQGRGKSGKNNENSPVAQALFGEALRHHQAGRLAEAEQLYRQALAADPRHPDSLHLLGVLAHQVGRSDVAVELIGQAIAARGDVAFFHNNLGNALKTSAGSTKREELPAGAGAQTRLCRRAHQSRGRA